jgi:hypothetical protein
MSCGRFENDLCDEVFDRSQLPEPPPGLTWPKDYRDTKYFNTRGGILRYLENEWLAFINIGAVDMRLLRA